MTDACRTAARFESRAGPFAMVSAFCRSALQAIMREARVRRDRRHLEAAPDHILKDLGIHRSEVRAITRMGREAYGRGRQAERGA